MWNYNLLWVRLRHDLQLAVNNYYAFIVGINWLSAEVAALAVLFLF